jgi:hypothetical protein
MICARGTLFLGGDERPQHAVGGFIQGADNGVVVVDTAAVDADYYHVRAWAPKCLAPEVFERIAADLAVELAGGGTTLRVTLRLCAV